jgi:hypothetical protein
MSITSATIAAGVFFSVGVAVALVPLVVLVGAARLQLKRHTPAQILAGTLVGAIVPVVVLLVLNAALAPPVAMGLAPMFAAGLVLVYLGHRREPDGKPRKAAAESKNPPRLGSASPMALAFHRRSIERDLDDLARSLGGDREPGVAAMPLLPAGTPELLDAAGEPGDEARAELAQELRALTASAAELSNRLSRRYFAHIESDAQALAT